MSLQAYTFPTSDNGSSVSAPITITGYAPFTIVFQPSAINLGNNVVQNITYSLSGNNYPYTFRVDRNFTYVSLTDALTGLLQVDSRSNYSHTFFNTVSGQSVTYATITATLFPSFVTVSYVLKVQTNNPWLSYNPLSSTGEPSVFQRIHLIKSRSWGTNNSQLIIAEGINNLQNGQIVLFNTSDFTSGASIKPDKPNPSATPSPTPTPSLTPTVTPSVTITPTPTVTTTPSTFALSLHQQVLKKIHGNQSQLSRQTSPRGQVR